MTPHPRAAIVFADLIRQDLLSYRQAADALERAAHAGNHDLTDLERFKIATHAINTLIAHIHSPELAASAAIKTAIGPMMQVRAKRADLLVAAYRAADGRMNARAVESVVSSEMAAYLARVKENNNVRS